MPAKTKVREIMTTSVISFSPDDKIQHVIETFRNKKISGAPVAEGEKVVGVITEADLIKLVSTISLPEVELNVWNPFVFLAIRSYWKKVEKIPDEVKEKYETLLNGSVRDVMSKEPVTVAADASISEASGIMSKRGFNRLPVVEGGKLVGIIARQDILSVFAQ